MKTHYFIPCIQLLILFLNKSIITPEINPLIQKIKKKSTKPLIGIIPSNFGVIPVVGFGYRVDNNPASKFEIAVDANHTPISNDAKRVGDNLATTDCPVGDMHNSA